MGENRKVSEVEDCLGELVEVFTERPLLAKYDGVPIPPNYFPKRYWQETKRYQPEDDDVFIATYPKSGTTWLQAIFCALIFDDLCVDRDRRLYRPFLELDGTKLLGKRNKAVPLKTHLPFELTPYSDGAKYIYCVRNPKDCCVSFYHFTLRVSENLEGYSFDEHFENFMGGKMAFGNYWDHIESWMPQVSKKDNVLLVTYEDMKTDILGGLKRIGEFIGGDLGARLMDEERAEEVASLSSFESMKLRYKDTLSDRYIRKGTVNDWKNQLSEEQSRRIYEETHRRLSDLCPELLCKWKKFGALDGDF